MDQPAVSICESVLRDGIQGWPVFIPTDAKVALLDAIVAAGFMEIDVTSFVPTKVVPQFADATTVLAAVPAGVKTRVLTVNVKGVERVIIAAREVRPIDFCGIPFSASEAHNLANLRVTHKEHRANVAAMTENLLRAGICPLVAVATAFGCPIAGDVDPDEVFGIVRWLHSLGVTRVMFGDTTGMADPTRAKALIRLAVKEWPEIEFIAHFHDNRGCGVANSIAALEAGASSVDSSLGGVGGEPSSVDQGDVGESGNTTSEDLAAVLERMGIDTGLQMEDVLSAGQLLEKTVGRSLHSRVQRAGPIKQPRAES